METEVISEDSFKISGRGIFIELRHTQNGLAKGVQLISERTGRIWRVMERVLFDHAVAEQRLFEIESTDYVLMKFESLEKRQKSINEIKERESQNIYHYLIEPIEHEEKPEYKEKLKINYP